MYVATPVQQQSAAASRKAQSRGPNGAADVGLSDVSGGQRGSWHPREGGASAGAGPSAALATLAGRPSPGHRNLEEKFWARDVFWPVEFAVAMFQNSHDYSRSLSLPASGFSFLFWFLPALLPQSGLSPGSKRSCLQVPGVSWAAAGAHMQGFTPELSVAGGGFEYPRPASSALNLAGPISLPAPGAAVVRRGPGSWAFSSSPTRVGLRPKGLRHMSEQD